MGNVVSTGGAREALHRIARRFDAGETDPVYFGSYRRAQGVIVPVAAWESLLEPAQDELDIAPVRKRVAASAQSGLSGSDLDGAFVWTREAAAGKPA